MKKALFALFGCFAAMSALAEDAHHVLPMPHITIDGAKTALPTVQRDDGAVCVSYVSEVRREGGKLVSEVKQICTIQAPSSPF